MNTDRFYELHLDEKFEILELGTGKEHQHKFRVKCKVCGCAWWNWDDVLRKDSKYIYCPGCGSTNRVYKIYEGKGYPSSKADWEGRVNNSLLANSFSFIEANSKKIRLKCKNCGESFWKDKGIFHRLTENACACPKCKINQFGFKGSVTVEPKFVQQIVDMYSSGKEQKEIVETVGQDYSVVRYWLKKKDLYDPNRRQTNKEPAVQGILKNNEKIKQEAEMQLAFSLLEKGFAYLGGYDGNGSTVSMSCLSCGKDFTRYVDKTFKKKTAIECPFCGEKATAKLEKEAERLKKKEEYEKQLAAWEKAREERELEKQRIIDEPRVCLICNKTFSIREYAESIGVDPIYIPTVVYCSKKCKNKAHKSSSDHIKRAKRHGCEWERGITWHSAVKRLGLRCAICGGICDPNDTSYGNGSGPLYPTVDHIVPIAKGGAHKWENVQIAHHICNSLKNDKIV